MESNNEFLNDIWSVFTTIYTCEKEVILEKESNKCKYCEKLLDQYICTNCGHVINEQEYLSEINISDNIVLNNKIKYNKYNLWYKWSNAEKNLYNIELYTKNICNQLNIDKYIDYICDIVKMVMILVKNDDCSKRNHLKKAIIILCIMNVFPSYSINTLSTKLELNPKYITKAEKNIKELIYKKKLHSFDKKSIDKIKSFDQIQQLINYCKENDILQEHSPKSIEYVCTFYILKCKSPELTITKFCKLHDMISPVTISKIYKKLEKEINVTL